MTNQSKVSPQPKKKTKLNSKQDFFFFFFLILKFLNKVKDSEQGFKNRTGLADSIGSTRNQTLIQFAY